MADAVATTNETRIGLRADMTIDDEAVAIEGVIGKDFFLQLNKPASLGTPISFAYWLKKTYEVDGLGIMLPTKYKDGADFKKAYLSYKLEKNETKREDFEKSIKSHLGSQGIPAQLQNLMTTALLAELTITDLLIDIKGEGEAQKKKMMFGLSVGFPKPLALLPNIDVNKVSILVMNAPKNDFNFPKRVELPRSLPLPIEPARATGSITFSDNPTDKGAITFGADKWTFVDTATDEKKREVKLGDSLAATLTSLEAALNAAKTGDTAKCEYVANLDDKQLEITYKTIGLEGNGFAIDADAKSKGDPSGLTLEGGQGEPETAEEKKAESASGHITFGDEVPAANSNVTLNGVQWKFVDGIPKAGAKETKIGADVKATVQSLAEGLSASDDDEIKKCSYTASEHVLTIIFKEKGSAGESFKLAASKESKATVSAKTLTL
jgi:hypothetical protein